MVLSSHTSFNQLKSAVTNSLFCLNSHYSVSYFLIFHLHSSNFLSFFRTFSFIWNHKNSSWLISIPFSACDTKVSMLLSLLLANIRIWSCFFFFCLVMVSNFFIIPVVRVQIKVKLAAAIPTRSLATLTEEIIQTPPLVAPKSIKILSM